VQSRNLLPDNAPRPADPGGHHLITRLNALVLLGRLDVVEVDRVVRDEDWKRARRLIRSVRDIRPLPAWGQCLPSDRGPGRCRIIPIDPMVE
jgi:hypothetical protein